MSYTPSYEKPYENGWKDLPTETTPVTAEILDSYDTAFETIENELVTLDGNITQVNNNLTDYGLDNKFDGNALQGYYNTTSGQFVSDKQNVCCASKIACDGGQSIRVILNKSLYFRAIFYNASGSVVGNYISSGADTEFNIVANANAKSFTFYSSSNRSLIPNVSEAKTYRVYVDNAIDEIKNDLVVIKSQEYELTTNEYSLINIPIQKEIASVKVISPTGSIALVGYSGDVAWIRVTDYALSGRANTTVKFKVRYYD